ncbi:hypothetical protein WJX72_001744 [[Myrmecia] bisecta]|uniref:Uncharacterized protein n=1 Tax=[Myrmecia] bisecta TaxID=41462 RepID=A0AAW1Q5K3_9CHLO
MQSSAVLPQQACCGQLAIPQRLVRAPFRTRVCASLESQPPPPRPTNSTGKQLFASQAGSKGKVLNVRASQASGSLYQLDQSGNGGGNNSGSGDGGNWGDGEGGGGGGAGAGALLMSLGRSADSFPADFAAALKAGKVSKELLQRYLDLESNFFLRLFLPIQGFRERLLGDPQFPVKVAIEVAIGMTMKILAELNKRGDSFKQELDFVFANVVMALAADFMLVWLPAPRATFGAAAPRKQNALSTFLSNCPDNSFQVVPPGRAPFTGLQRLGAIGKNGAQLLGVGFFASILGVTVTNGLLAVRQMLDPTFKPPNAPQGVIKTSLAYGSYMATSSNLRYQIIAGVLEERGIERLFAGSPAMCSALSFAVRTGNTFLGSLMWVDFLRLTGLQKKSTAPRKATA